MNRAVNVAELNFESCSGPKIKLTRTLLGRIRAALSDSFTVRYEEQRALVARNSLAGVI